MCMGFAKDIKAWVCLTEQNQRDGMLQAWANSLADMGNLEMLNTSLAPAVTETTDTQVAPSSIGAG